MKQFGMFYHLRLILQMLRDGRSEFNASVPAFSPLKQVHNVNDSSYGGGDDWPGVAMRHCVCHSLCVHVQVTTTIGGGQAM